jgi:hypothetical protein
VLHPSAGARADGGEALPLAVLCHKAILDGGVDQGLFYMAGVKGTAGDELVKTERGAVELVVSAAIRRHSGQSINFRL